MALSRFSIVVTMEQDGGIALDGEIPWEPKRELLKHTRDLTTGEGGNTVIMGRTTYESLGGDAPLKNRHNIVVSSTAKPTKYGLGVQVCASLLDALFLAGSAPGSFGTLFVCGGAQLFEAAVRDFLYLCDEIHVTVLSTRHKCDTFFPLGCVQAAPHQVTQVAKASTFKRFVYRPALAHQEAGYLSLLRDVWERGNPMGGSAEKKLFGQALRFSVGGSGPARAPLVTTRRIEWKKALGDLFSSKGFEEFLQTAVDELGTDATEVTMACPPTFADATRVIMVQFSKVDAADHASNGHAAEAAPGGPAPRGKKDKGKEKETAAPAGFDPALDCLVTIPSVDVFVDLPIEIFMAAVVLYVVAMFTQRAPRDLVVVLGEARVGVADVNLIWKQAARTPRPFPKLEVDGRSRLHDLSQLLSTNIVVKDYFPFI